MPVEYNSQYCHFNCYYGFIRKGWSRPPQFNEKCQNCGQMAEEDFDYFSMTTGRKLRCKNCKIEASIDETTQFSNPEKYKYFIDNFVN